MSLNEDPEVTLRALKKGLFSPKEAERQVKDLLAEISSGIWSFEQLGLEGEEDLMRYADLDPRRSD
ncbi:MAG: hypothetical protein PHH24_02075 [Candidatus Moranbacteria bacterium]|nr:hypothetical protein [Candidatus Moranbacteria bacterium]MDD5652472.1 hypothetical protein [Candidatus Moranbacteria bacterium]MDX9855974.1 hypothetical protein [Candidatus Moranbacteria bacterium]